MRNRLNWQILLSVFISLLMVVVFVPEPGKDSQNTVGPISKSISSQDYSMQAIPPSSPDDYWGVKSEGGRTSSKIATTRALVASLLTYAYSTSDQTHFIDSASNSDNIFRKYPKQVYQLLDIPPPSDADLAPSQNS